MANPTVTAPLIVVHALDGTQQYLSRGVELPDYVDKDTTKLLLEQGLVEKGRSTRSKSAPSAPKSSDTGDGAAAGATDGTEAASPRGTD